MIQTYNLSAQETAGFKVILCYILYYSLYQNKDKTRAIKKWKHETHIHIKAFIQSIA